MAVKNAQKKHCGSVLNSPNATKGKVNILKHFY